MSTVDPVEQPERPLRLHFTSELHELKLQTEMMGVLVDQNLERMREVLSTGDRTASARALAADDEIDAMNASLTEHCYLVLARENPMASDLRLVVSVIRVTAAFERIGDLALRIAKLVDDQALMAASSASFDILSVMADVAVDRFREALRSWATDDLDLASDLASGSHTMDLNVEKLAETLMGLEGPDAVRIALRSLVAGHSLQRISDHATILGRRIQYLLTGDPAHLTAEVR
jgi:phosphate transport system protein